MKHFLICLILSFLLFACKSVPEKVRENKNKFIQLAQENSKPIDFSDISNLSEQLLEQGEENNTEGKIKYLGVDKMETVYVLGANSKIQLDSIVIFTKSNYTILYDFATIARAFELVQQKSNLENFEKLDDRLYIGKN